ncbi:dihydrolipoyl dehydrogenase [Halorubrum sp. DTA98]|uniref:dihydrolipoyl dehydrogenase n=1 Tax=Halorubrum sp. DTA98 TaxID=3402163 RepID=UPI003AAB4E0C
MSRRSLPSETDVLVIGGGPGGYVAAIRAGQLGLDVALVDREYGGTCLNYGCIPSKAMITATGIAHEAETATEMGIHADIEYDFVEMVDWKDGVVDRLTRGVEKLCKANQVSLIDGYAEFVADNRARIDLTEGEDHEIDFDDVIVATGSSPIEIPGFSFDDEPVLSSRDALGLTAVPDSLVIVGAGYIGMELAGVFAKLGTDITVVEMLDSVLPGYDPDLVRPVKTRAEELGVDFNFGEGASEWRESDDGIVVTTRTEDGDESLYESDKVLVAVGRSPVTDTLNLDAIGLEPNDSGFLETDDRARTTRDHVYAVGDVAGEPMLAHKASAEGEVAAEVIAGHSSALDHRAIPAAVFTEPEIAMVGMTERESREAGIEPTVGEFPFRASGRSLTLDNVDGFVRIVAAADTGRVIGGQIVGPEASELIAIIGGAIETESTLTDIASTIHSHPTLSEAVMEASQNALGRAIHTLNR